MELGAARRAHGVLSLSAVTECAAGELGAQGVLALCVSVTSLLSNGSYPHFLIHQLSFAKLFGISVNNQALSVSRCFSPPEFIAMYTYESSEQGDLTFQQGDVILVTKKDGDWWTGTVGDKSGVFPSNYVRLKDSEVNPHLTVSSPFLFSDSLCREAQVSDGGDAWLGFAKFWSVAASTA